MPHLIVILIYSASRDYGIKHKITEFPFLRVLLVASTNLAIKSEHAVKMSIKLLAVLEASDALKEV